MNGETLRTTHSVAKLNPGEAYLHYFAFDWPEDSPDEVEMVVLITMEDARPFQLVTHPSRSP